MARIQLLGGADVRRSPLASIQRSENLFSEKNAEGAASPQTLYVRPGLRKLGAVPQGPWRGLYQARAAGRAFGVAGTGFYEIKPDWSFIKLADLPNSPVPLVAMQDNRLELFVSQGPGPGWTLDLAREGKKLLPLEDPDGFFTGATRIIYQDTFLLWNFPGDNKFGSTVSNTVAPLDSTYIAAITSTTGDLVSLAEARGNVLLIGERATEIWNDVGALAFPWARVPNSTIEHGCCAPYSVVQSGEAVYWIGQDDLGLGHVYRVVGYKINAVSSPTVDWWMSGLAPDVLRQAVGYAHQSHGHRFIVWTFPGTDYTWAMDEQTEEWDRRTWVPAKGAAPQRDRVACAGLVFGQMVAGDRENGNLYAFDPRWGYDGADNIRCVRGFPHIGVIPGPNGPVSTDGKVLNFNRFQADIEVGTALEGETPELILRYSSDRGKTWGQDLLTSTGLPGEFETSPLWQTLGRSRDMVFELEWSYAGPVALQGAWIEVEMHGQ